MNLIIMMTSLFAALSSRSAVCSSIKQYVPLYFTPICILNSQRCKYIKMSNQVFHHHIHGSRFFHRYRFVDMKVKPKGKYHPDDSSIPSSLSSYNTNLHQLYNIQQWKYKPRSDNQIKYVDYLINPNVSIVGGFGPAGSGKTLFACHAAVGALKAGLVDKIVITRPLISVDEEELGFLPGSIANKMDPWTRPIFDILGEFYTANQIHSMVENGVIEISPLAYMRGRTFKRAFIIADEMQNSSPNQMLMMLTRIGEASKLVITGDLKQSDRPGINGLRDFIQKLRGVSHRLSYDDDGHENSLIQFVELENCDIQRSAVVAHVLSIYAADAEKVNHIKHSDAAIIPKGYEPKSYTL
jgi:phosphate starvation-inducible protein PhoH